jgi:hypothetical protein
LGWAEQAADQTTRQAGLEFDGRATGHERVEKPDKRRRFLRTNMLDQQAIRQCQRQGEHLMTGGSENRMRAIDGVPRDRWPGGIELQQHQTGGGV